MARGPKGPRYLALELASTHLTTRAARGAEWASGPTERSARVRGIGPPGVKMERETGFEPATSTLARSHSTTELFPLAEPLKYHDRLDQGYGGVRLKQDATGRRIFALCVPCSDEKVVSRLKYSRIRIVRRLFRPFRSMSAFEGRTFVSCVRCLVRSSPPASNIPVYG